MTRVITKQEEQAIWKAKNVLLKAYSVVRGNLKSSGMLGGLLILFLLALHQEGLLRKGGGGLIIAGNNLRRVLESEHLCSSKKSIYARIRSYLLTVKGKSIDKDIVQNVTTLILKINLESIGKNYFALFDQALFGFLEGENTTRNVHVLPVEISYFMSRMAQLQPEDRVFNPFAGMASFGLFFREYDVYRGQEIDKKAYYLGMLRSLAYGAPAGFDFRNEDVLLNWPKENEQYDVLISSPPFIAHNKTGLAAVSAGEWMLNPERLTKILSPKGRFVLLLSEEVLFAEGPYHTIRKFLVDNNLLEYVITLPGGVLSHTGVTTVILVGDKNKKVERVKFVDAKDCLTKKTTSEKELNAEKLLARIAAGSNQAIENNDIKTASKEEICSNDYLLLKSRYNQDAYKGEILSQILTKVGEATEASADCGKVVRVKDLRKAGDPSIEVEYAALEKQPLQPGEKGLRISESCLLIAVQGDELKPTYFNYEGNSLCLGPNVKAFKVNDLNRIDVEFLIFELRSDLISEQIASLRIGSVTQHLSVKDFLQVKIISVPADRTEQENRARLFRTSLEKITELAADQEALVEQKIKESFDETASLNHSIGRPLENISSWSHVLHDYLKNEEGELVDQLNKRFAQHYENGYDIFKVLSEVNKDAKFIAELMRHAEKGIVLTEFPLRLITVSEINTCLKGMSHGNNKYVLNYTLESSEATREQGILANLKLLKIMMDNLIANAEIHGFQDLDSPTKEVVIETRLIEDRLILEVKNTGHPFPEDFTRHHYIQKFNTTRKNDIAGESSRQTSGNRGLGGYDVNRIAVHLGAPDWRLISKPEAFYTVRFVFEFPLKQIK